jgi:serine/threonine protein kinase
MRDPLIGHRLANFVIERVLGRGGMAQVYFGRDVNLQRPVAIKVIDAQYRDDPAYAIRFVNEARAVASWRHEHIVQVYYADQEEGLYYFVMEYIDGMDLASLLRQYVDEGELMPHDDVLKIGRAIASALDFAHSKGVIHRDVKPSNVMISADDRVVLTDFGLALDVQQGSMGEVFGSPHYIAPEQARRSADAIPASDLYSLGVMLYEMLTGTVPFDDPSPASLALQHLALPPPAPRGLNPALNESTENVLLKALSKEPSARYSSATALLNALDAALSQPSRSTSTAKLPPMPAGIEVRSLSRRTVSERVALHARSTRTEFMPDPPRIASTAEHRSVSGRGSSSASHHTGDVTVAYTPRRSPLLGIVAALVVLAIIIVAVLGLVLTNANRGGQNVAEALATSPVVEIPTTAQTVEVVSLPTEIISPTATPIPPTAAPPPTDVPALEPVIPTATSIPPSPTPVPPTDLPLPVPAQPTVLYPSGKRIEFLWDANSFYWYNAHSESIRVSPIRFEAINTDGQPIGYTFEGSRWAGVGFNLVETGKCSTIEITRAPGWMRPSQCRGYNSFVNTLRESDLVFWAVRDGVTQFRVLWDLQEIARCEIASGWCEVYVP